VNEARPRRGHGEATASPWLCVVRRVRGGGMPRRGRGEAEAGSTRQDRGCARRGGAEAMWCEADATARLGEAGPRGGQGEAVERGRGADARPRRVVEMPSRGAAWWGGTGARLRGCEGGQTRVRREAERRPRRARGEFEVSPRRWRCEAEAWRSQDEAEAKLKSGRVEAKRGRTEARPMAM
jgi:hypothetical protein